ncbi:MAG: peptidylprolyl isomerase [Pseudomonadota bacterium]
MPQYRIQCPTVSRTMSSAFAAAFLSAGLAMPSLAQTTDAETPAAAETPATPSADASSVIATVNGEDILLGDMIALRAELPAQYQSIPDTVLYEGLLEQMTNQILLRQAAERSGFADKPSVQRGLEFQRTSYLAELYARDRLNDALTEERLTKEYEDRYLNAEATKEWNASHILVSEEAAAQEIAGLARAEGADFAELAKERSEGPSAPNGGSLGWFAEGQMVPTFQAAVFELTEGEVSDPVQTQFGWHVIKLEGIRDKPAPALAEVQEELIGALSNEITGAVVEALRDSADINTPEGQPGVDQLRNDALVADE